MYAAYRNRVETAFLADELAATADLDACATPSGSPTGRARPGGERVRALDSAAPTGAAGAPRASGGLLHAGLPGSPGRGAPPQARELSRAASAAMPDQDALAGAPGVGLLTPGSPSPADVTAAEPEPPGDGPALGMGSPDAPFSPHGDAPAPPLVSSAMADLGHLAPPQAGAAAAATGAAASAPAPATPSPAAAGADSDAARAPNPTLADLMALARRTVRRSARLAAADTDGTALLSVSPHVAAAPPESEEDADSAGAESASDADDPWAAGALEPQPGSSAAEGAHAAGSRADAGAGSPAPAAAAAAGAGGAGGAGGAAVEAGASPAAAGAAAGAARSPAAVAGAVETGEGAPARESAAGPAAAAEEGGEERALRRRLTRRHSSRELLDPLTRAAREVRRAQSAAAATAAAAAAGEDAGAVLADAGAAAAAAAAAAAGRVGGRAAAGVPGLAEDEADGGGAAWQAQRAAARALLDSQRIYVSAALSNAGRGLRCEPPAVRSWPLLLSTFLPTFPHLFSTFPDF